MFLIFISLITGYIGMALGSSSNAGGIFGLVGFLSPTIFLLQKMYIKLEEVEKKLD
ncbi:hypothetical protein [Clostridium formicaceticum]|uniref:Uncharacterized protein n=1 Tax=Clostridium formicaceticum TaxID=1497 RepID=A0AAC9RKX3_9CLOT|nr:hypothetical protein [Clostridium formicaceticum]ARE87183.1 hypothetical protein CLFO_15710 [Clostridium formicaceticum]